MACTFETGPKLHKVPLCSLFGITDSAFQVIHVRNPAPSKYMQGLTLAAGRWNPGDRLQLRADGYVSESDGNQPLDRHFEAAVSTGIGGELVPEGFPSFTHKYPDLSNSSLIYVSKDAWIPHSYPIYTMACLDDI